MKTKLIVAIVILFGTLATFANSGKRSSTNLTSKKINVTSGYVKVVVGENLKVVFTNDFEKEISIEGNSKFVEHVNANVVNGVLSISLKGYSASIGTVYVPVRNNLSLIEVKSSAKIYSNGFLNCNNLQVLINSDSYANLKNRGKIQFNAIDSELEFQKYQSIAE